MGSCRQFDVGLSFSSKDRPFVEALHSKLSEFGVKAFLDDKYQSTLLGKHLTEELPVIYRDRCDLFVPIISADYLASVWARAEKRAALEAALTQEGFVLPIRLDSTQVPGISSTIADLRTNTHDHENLANSIATYLLLRRLVKIDSYYDRIQVNQYKAAYIARLTPGSESYASPLGQAHMALTCRIADAELQRAAFSISDRCMGPTSADPLDLPPQTVMDKIIRKFEYNAPSYWLQITFLTAPDQIVAHRDMPAPTSINTINLAKSVRNHICRLIRDGHRGVNDDRFVPQFFAWCDLIRFSKHQLDINNDKRQNIGMIYPEMPCGSGSGPPLCPTFVFGEIHLKMT